jgi:DNA primase catalytic core
VARYTEDSRERVRAAVDMVDLVGTRVELRRAGATRYEGLCPLCDERTPSFDINPAGKLFHCFACGEGGDAFRFVQLTEGLDFKGALELVADRYGVQLEVVEEDPAAAERRRARDRLLELLERTAAWYVRVLWGAEEAEPARAFLASRGLEEGLLREFRVGYAPSAWDRLLLASRRAGFCDRELVAAGLASRARGEGRTYDRFRRRIMFPLCDARGRVLGFGARAVGEGQQPRYLNSSDNAIYHSGRQLFGADIARAHAARAGSVIVAERYTDVIAMHQAGLRNTVGLTGTALTEEQVGELARLARSDAEAGRRPRLPGSAQPLPVLRGLGAEGRADRHAGRPVRPGHGARRAAAPVLQPGREGLRGRAVPDRGAGGAPDLLRDLRAAEDRGADVRRVQPIRDRRLHGHVPPTAVRAGREAGVHTDRRLATSEAACHRTGRRRVAPSV